LACGGRVSRIRRAGYVVTTAQPEQPEEEPEPLLADTPQLGGVWANWARVVESEHEFTIDFVRLDYATEPPHQGIIVARVAISPILLAKLAQTLEEILQKYTEKGGREVMRDE
jgi:Protein of unknown function (DUF3467)